MSSGAEDWVKERLLVLSHVGGEMVCECPACGGDRLYINPEKGAYICYKGCWSGRLVRLVAAVDKVSLKKAAQLIEEPLPRGMEELRELLNRPLEIDDDTVVQQLPDEFIACFDIETGGLRVPGYADNPIPSRRDDPPGRGLDDCTLLKHGLGFAFEGRYRDRLIAPVHCDGNKTFLARLMGHPSDFAWTHKDTGARIEPPKYLHPKDARISQFLYWWDHLPTGADVVLTEGIYDTIRLSSFGIPAVAEFGKRLTAAQLKLLKRKKPAAVTIFYDAGAKTNAAQDAWTIKNKLRIPVRIAVPPGDHDPDSYGFHFGREATLKLLTGAKPVESQYDALASAIEEIRQSF